jgi:hypothetical protein
MLIRINIKTVFDTGISVPNLITLLSIKVKRATIIIIAIIITPSRLRLKLSCVGLIEGDLVGELFFIVSLASNQIMTE